MTTLISRLFPDEATAQSAVGRLTFRGVPKGDCTIITSGERAEALMARARVHETAIRAYSKHLNEGKAVLAVRASYKPLGAARLTREVLSKYDVISVDRAIEESSLPWEPDNAPSVLKDHPLFFSIPGLSPPGRISSMFGMPLLKRRKAKNNLMEGSRRMSRMFWPMPLLKAKRDKRSVISGGRYMSRAFWPMPLLSKGERRKSVKPGGGFPLSRRLGIRTISAR
jgi:hypothetical protein